uniref:Uncharacterized protein n=1 Tax=Picea sitchensis TaxID=3332 RepID=B8LM85_PICSI|nr:unknown [Picea sitchensis]
MNNNAKSIRLPRRKARRRLLIPWSPRAPASAEALLEAKYLIIPKYHTILTTKPSKLTYQKARMTTRL